MGFNSPKEIDSFLNGFSADLHMRTRSRSQGTIFSIACATWYRPSGQDPNKIQLETKKTAVSLDSMGILMGHH